MSTPLLASDACSSARDTTSDARSNEDLRGQGAMGLL
jgi:hypothetical protein